MSRSKNRFLRKLYNSRVSKHRALPKRKTLRFESLESKQMLSGTPFQLDFADLAVEASTHHGSAEVAGAFNGDGLTGDLHNNSFNDSWATTAANAAGKWWITVDLGGTYDLESLKVWNGNAFALTHRGIKQGDIFIAGDDLVDQNTGGLNVAFDPSGGWEELIENQNFTKAVYGTAVSPSDPFIDLQGVEAAHLAIRVDSLWGGNRLTLSEIQIFASDATPATPYDLTVDLGTGDGSYVLGETTTIVADAPAAGQIFSNWTGSDAINFGDINSATTTFTMPAGDATITANYVAETFDLTVDLGTGDGAYQLGESTTIAADAAQPGQVFVAWAGSDASNFGDINSATTTFTMPTGDTTITATYALVPYVLTVDLGTGDGTYTLGESTTIVADAAQSGFIFSGWAGSNASNFGDVTSATTTFTMPVGNTTITANYVTLDTFDLIVDLGTGDGSYLQGQTASIAADAASTGQVFLAWAGSDASNFGDINSPTTTFTMPATDTTITATYVAETYDLTVDLGTGDGAYTLGESASITADAAQPGQVFVAWTGSAASNFGNINSASTTFAMPASDTTLTATYALVPYVLTVDLGTGDGTYTLGESTTIVADAAASGMVFSGWSGSAGSNFANITSSTTTFTMPVGDTTITANYTTINTGGGEEVIPYSELTLVASSTNSFSTSNIPIDDVFNGEGITSPTNGDPDTHDGNWVNSWISSSNGAATSAAGEWITIDLNGTYDLTSLEIWNGNQTGVLYRAIQQGDIYVAQSGLVDSNVSRGTGGASNPFDSTGGWMELIPNYQFTQSPGGNITSTDTIDLTDPQGLGRNLGVSHLAIRVDSSFSGQEIALAEIRISRSTGTVATSSLTVNGGTGSGVFDVGSSTPIAANTAPSGQVFSSWTGSDASNFGDVTSASTTFTMQAGDSDITANYVAETFDLTVDLGTGDGAYQLGESTTIVADAAQPGQVFVAWAGSDASNFGDINSATTTFTMPTGDTTITATYALVPYVLTVDLGTGDGTYTLGESTTIVADAAQSGFIFSGWGGSNASNFGDVTSATTTFTMPVGNTTITANYVTLDTFDLIVDLGTGDGSYLQGQTASIAADAASTGQVFLAWAGSDASNFGDINSPTTTFTMPATDTTITATYVAETYDLTVDLGTGDGAYTLGESASITADAAQPGQVFVAWTGSAASNFGNINSASTTFAMPASDTTLTATYALVPYVLTVDLGTGDGTYTLGESTTIVADAAASGMVFSGWSGSAGSNFANITSSTTTFTMPVGDTTITANYTAINTGGGEEVIPYSELTLVASSTNSFSTSNIPIDDVFNGEGITSPTNGDPDTHDGNWVNSWISSSNGAATSAAGEWITIDLNGTYDLTSLEIWNGNQTGVLHRAIQQGDIYVAQSGLVDSNVSRGTGGASNPFDSTGGWMELIPNYQFTQSPGGNITSTDTIDLTDPQGLGRNLGVSHLAIRVDSSFSGQEIALAEIRISRSTGTVATSSLTVNDGTGSGVFEVGSDTPIAANAPAAGQIFSNWTGSDASNFGDVTSASTTFTMQAGDSDITANYVPIQSFDLVVNGGTGGGSILAGSSVTISAPETISTGVFSGWTGSDAGNFLNINSATTTFTMPSSITTLTANYSTVGVGSGIEVIPFSELTLTASSVNTFGETSLERAFDSTGLINDFHNNISDEAWISADVNPQAAGEWIKIDLNGSYDLASLEIWNGNQAGLTGRGIKQGNIYVAKTDPGNSVPSSENVAGSGWTPLIINQLFTQASGASYIESTDTIPLIDPTGQNEHQGVSYLAIYVDSTFMAASSGVKSVAISEIRISRAAVTRTLNVLSGTGSALYAEGEVAQIDAATPSSGEVFYAWTGDVSNVADIYAASTTFTMPANGANVTATYGLTGPFNLTVENGTGGGNNTTGTLVNVQAATAPAGQEFRAWVGSDASLLADPFSSSTSLVMPPSNANVTAEYITVNAGAADLALGKTIAAVSSSGTYQGISRPAQNALDGNENTYWLSADSPTPWFAVDLGQTYSHIDRVNLDHYTGNDPHSFATEYYIDYLVANGDVNTESDWIQAFHTEIGHQGQNVDAQFNTPVEARYVRYRAAGVSNPVTISGFQVYQKRSLHELVQRDGTPNFIEKLEGSQPVDIVYFGGSVTVQPDGWSTQTQGLFKELYATSTSNVPDITAHNLAYGGQPSGFAVTDEVSPGVTRVDQAVAINPDLVFIEYAINDEASQTYEETISNIDSMIQDLWAGNVNTDIVFVYTFKQSFDYDLAINAKPDTTDPVTGLPVRDESRNIHTQPVGTPTEPLSSSGAPFGDSGERDDVLTLNAGYYQTAAAAIEELADYYGIPSIHMGIETAARVPTEVRIDSSSTSFLTHEDGFEVWSEDGVHPHVETGHVWYTEALTRSFNEIKLVSGNFPHNPEDPNPRRQQVPWPRVPVAMIPSSPVSLWSSSSFRLQTRLCSCSRKPRRLKSPMAACCPTLTLRATSTMLSSSWSNNLKKQKKRKTLVPCW